MVLDKVENIENIKSEGEGKGKDEQFGKKNQLFQSHQKVITGETKTKYKKNENQGNNASTGEEDKNNKNTIKTNKPETIFSDTYLTDTTTANTVKEMKYMKKNMDNINQRKIQQPIKIKTYTQITISYQLFLLWKH